MVSVVVLSRERIPQKLLDDLRRQTYRDFEFISAAHKGVVKAMNIALKRAKGDIFVRIDDDVKLPPDWLQELIIPFGDPKVAGATGPTYVSYLYRKNRDSLRIAEKPNRFLRWLFDNDPFAPAKIYKCGSVSYGSNFNELIKYDKEYRIDHLEGTNWAMRTELIRRVGGFDPAFDGVAEWFDDDVVFKIKKLGYKIEYNPEAYLWHMPGKDGRYGERHAGLSRIKNWLRFHRRHSRFHYKKVVWLMAMVAYFLMRKNK